MHRGTDPRFWSGPLEWIGVVCLVAVFGFAQLEAQIDRPRPKRLVLLKSDGLPPDLLAAVSFPERDDLMERLPYADYLRPAIAAYQRRTGRRLLLPNIRKYFFDEGVFVENMYSTTLTLSAAAWAVIDTGQPSVIKGHAAFSRDTCYFRSYLDGFRDALDAVRRQGEKNTVVWQLDQVGVSHLLDAYDPDRTWTGVQILRRIGNRELLLEAGRRWLDNGEDGFGNIVRSHLSRLVTGIDYSEFNQEINAFMTARKILERDLSGAERHDYITPLFTLMDHQQHVDPHPRNLIHWLVKLDRVVGEAFESVEKSRRRDETVVALVSDHGSEIEPGKVAFSFPITRVFRTPQFGGHTVKTLLVESAWSALSTPIPGIDFPRVYESDFSPYGEKQNPRFGEGGYVTAVLDNFGNSRATVHLRNNDLNRLHLLLMRLREQPRDPARYGRLRQLFRETLDRTRQWLESDLRLFEDYHEASKDFASHLDDKADRYSRDVAWRLARETERDAPQLAALKRLLAIRFESDKGGLFFDDVFTAPFRIEDFIPKGYLGLANSVHQLSHYTVGLDDDLNWVETTVDPQGRPVPMNYFEIMSNYRAANAPANGRRNPFDVIVKKVPAEQIRPALLSHGFLSGGERLRNVLWVKSTARGNPRKGGEALIVEARDGRLKYLPVKDLEQGADSSFEFAEADDRDPLALLAGDGFEPVGGGPRLRWMRAFHPLRQWLRATYMTEYANAVTMFVDIFNDPVPEFVDNPDFQKYLIYFSSEEMKQRYLRGLKRKHASLQPDLIVWAEELWNYNSKARTSGGTHAGLRPMVARTTFLAWGGDDTGVARGKTVSEPALTLDFVPTLLQAVGMLDSENRVIRDPLSIPERPFLPFPGQVVDIWKPDYWTGQKTGRPENPVEK